MELYNRALIYKSDSDYNNYMIYLTMAANYEYKKAEDEFYISDDWHKQDFEVTIKFYQDNIEQPVPNAQSLNNLGYMYSEGNFVEMDKVMAKKLYKQAIEKGNKAAVHNLACLYCHEKKYNKAKLLFEKSSNYGNHFSIYNLANIYYIGHGIDKDYGKAKKLYEDAYKLGNVDTKYYLGEMYFYGLGCVKDYGKAIKLFEEGYKLGNVVAMNYVGNMYYYGLGVDKDYVKAIKMFEEAYKLGSNEALDDLGNIYCFGLDVGVDYNRGLELLLMASNSGNVNAPYYLAKMYECGLGVTKNYDTALIFYKQASDKKCTFVFNNLITLFQTDYFIDKQSEIISYLNEINHLEILKDIYNFSDFIIDIIKQKYESDTKIICLEKENLELRRHIDASPDGVLFLEARREWADKVNA